MSTLTDDYGDALEATADVFNHVLELELDSNVSEYCFGAETTRQLRDLCNETLGETTAVVNNITTTPAAPVDPNQAKLELAAIHGLRAKFVYTNLKGETHEVRLEPETVDTQAGRVYVGGDSFDEDGDFEGYKQYRLDSIEGAVAIR